MGCGCFGDGLVACLLGVVVVFAVCCLFGLRVVWLGWAVLGVVWYL